MTALALIEHDGEPRVRDVVLGTKLGMARPRDIRKLIERHQEALERFGACATVAHVVRGNPVTEYLLNEEQAVYLTTQSDAPNALETKVAVVKVFVAWRHGHLVPNDERSERQFGIARSTIHKVTALQGDVASISSTVALLAEQVRSLIITNDPRAAACDYRRALDVVTKLGALPKGRRALSRKAGNRMDRLSKAWAIPVKLSPERETRMFSAEVVAHWVETEGRALVAEHNARACGQGVLAFPLRRRPTDTPHD